MDVCLFLIATERAATTNVTQTIDAHGIHDLAATFPGIKRAVVHVPVEGGANDPYLHAEKPPRCTLQFYFESVDALENVLREGGSAHALLNLTGLKNAT